MLCWYFVTSQTESALKPWKSFLFGINYELNRDGILWICFQFIPVIVWHRCPVCSMVGWVKPLYDWVNCFLGLQELIIFTKYELLYLPNISSFKVQHFKIFSWKCLYIHVFCEFWAGIRSCTITDHLRAPQSLVDFKKGLKTFLLKKNYSASTWCHHWF